jgi:acyl-CoA-binding protein
MNTEELDRLFEEAYQKASNIDFKLPPDTMLKFYAYYKIATNNRQDFFRPIEENDLRNAFKMNALLQLSDLNAEDAKKLYIDLVNETLKNHSNN